MIKQIFTLIITLFLLSSCADSPGNYFKKSPNNRLIDSRGYKGSKRMPLHNKKYISKAKRNVIERNFDDDYDDTEYDDMDEMRDASRINRQIYADMVEDDARYSKKRRKFNNYRPEYDYDESPNNYPNLNKASKAAKEEDAAAKNEEMKKELSEIKAMLSEAKQDMAKYKCPMQPTAKTQESKPKSTPAPAPKKKSITELQPTYEDQDG